MRLVIWTIPHFSKYHVNISISFHELLLVLGPIFLLLVKLQNKVHRLYDHCGVGCCISGVRFFPLQSIVTPLSTFCLQSQFYIISGCVFRTYQVMLQASSRVVAVAFHQQQLFYQKCRSVSYCFLLCCLIRFLSSTRIFMSMPFVCRTCLQLVFVKIMSVYEDCSSFILLILIYLFI